MSHRPVAHDPSVADYRDTSPRCAQGGIAETKVSSLRVSVGRCRRLTPTEGS